MYFMGVTLEGLPIVNLDACLMISENEQDLLMLLQPHDWNNFPAQCRIVRVNLVSVQERF